MAVDSIAPELQRVKATAPHPASAASTGTATRILSLRLWGRAARACSARCCGLLLPLPAVSCLVAFTGKFLATREAVASAHRRESGCHWQCAIVGGTIIVPGVLGPKGIRRCWACGRCSQGLPESRDSGCAPVVTLPYRVMAAAAERTGSPIAIVVIHTLSCEGSTRSWDGSVTPPPRSPV